MEGLVSGYPRRIKVVDLRVAQPGDGGEHLARVLAKTEGSAGAGWGEPVALLHPPRDVDNGAPGRRALAPRRDQRAPAVDPEPPAVIAALHLAVEDPSGGKRRQAVRATVDDAGSLPCAPSSADGHGGAQPRGDARAGDEGRRARVARSCGLRTGSSSQLAPAV